MDIQTVNQSPLANPPPLTTPPPVTPTPIVTSDNNAKSFSLGLSAVFIFFFGLVIGFYIISPWLVDNIQINPPVVTKSNYAGGKQNNSFGLPPQILEYLEKPLLTNWAIRITGEIVNKADNYLIIETDGDKIKMIADDQTQFITVSSTPESATSVSFQDIKRGNFIQGSARVQYTNRQIIITGVRLGVE